MSQYYVYVYIDPRNFEEFYFGKGKGSRKEEHLFEKNESSKVKRIKQIQSEGLNPIIRVIAKGLSEKEALLVEKTLLWKLGGTTTNISTGHFSNNFRPHDTLHLELSEFDFQNGFYYYNIGESRNRNWDDYLRYSFISAGQGARWKDSLSGFKKGDVFTAYLKGKGYVGVGKIRETAKPIREVSIQGEPLLSLELKCKNMNDNVNSNELCEYICLVDWYASVERNEAKWEKSYGLYTTTHIKASLDAQPKTREFLEKNFNLNITNLMK